jgi:hypothetical protein
MVDSTDNDRSTSPTTTLALRSGVGWTEWQLKEHGDVEDFCRYPALIFDCRGFL